MSESTSRPRAVAAYRASGLGARFIAFCLVALTLAVGAGAVLDAPPAKGETADRYMRLWDDFSKKRKDWARNTSMCESGRVKDIHDSSGTYHGAFQFSKPTWKGAPKSPGGDPHRYSWKTQAVVAVMLKRQDGAGTHWPNCG
jgi:Transglycosylase-like domain